MRIKIDAGSRVVEIECSDTNVSPKDIAAEALAVWQATDGAKPDGDGPGYGFSSERRASQVSPMSMTRSYGMGWIGDPKADGVAHD